MEVATSPASAAAPCTAGELSLVRAFAAMMTTFQQLSPAAQSRCLSALHTVRSVHTSEQTKAAAATQVADLLLHSRKPAVDIS